MSIPFLKTKIVCTIGPACSDKATLFALCEAGMDVARLNMSHSNPDSVRATAGLIRECAARNKRPVALLVDLQGPKIRVGRLKASRVLSPGERVVLAPSDDAVAEELPVTNLELGCDLKQEDRILMNDGQIELRAAAVDPPRITAEVISGGTVASGKGINLPGVSVNAPALTEKDLADLDVALEIGAEYLALSFVRSAEHVRELQRRTPEDVLVMAKIEKEHALYQLDEVIEASDAIMVARGDLGTELPYEKVPLVQKRIVREANARCRPVIIATEMLESMIERSRPTRAEVSDAANAMLDGTDAVMLSAETAVGKHPAVVVQALGRVIREVEADNDLPVTGAPYDVGARGGAAQPASTEMAVARATLEAVYSIQAPVIVTFTRRGHTARVISSQRPPVPIVAITDSEKVQRQLALVWGVLPFLCKGDPTEENMQRLARNEIIDRRLANSGDRVVITAGTPFQVPGTTNFLKIEAL